MIEWQYFPSKTWNRNRKAVEAVWLGEERLLVGTAKQHWSSRKSKTRQRDSKVAILSVDRTPEWWVPAAPVEFWDLQNAGPCGCAR